jgi:hypothetical protein
VAARKPPTKLPTSAIRGARAVSSARSRGSLRRNCSSCESNSVASRSAPYVSPVSTASFASGRRANTSATAAFVDGGHVVLGELGAIRQRLRLVRFSRCRWKRWRKC